MCHLSYQHHCPSPHNRPWVPGIWQRNSMERSWRQTVPTLWFEAGGAQVGARRILEEGA